MPATDDPLEVLQDYQEKATEEKFKKGWYDCGVCYDTLFNWNMGLLNFISSTEVLLFLFEYRCVSIHVVDLSRFVLHLVDISSALTVYLRFITKR